MAQALTSDPQGGPPADRSISLHEKIYLVLTGLFLSAFLVTNIIAAKYFDIELFGLPLIYSVGIFPYPITFLITDIISEVYGKRRANFVVVVGFIVSVFSVLIIYVGRLAPIWEDSPLSQSSYDAVFQFAPRILLASMVAYLCAQFVDIHIFHFWKGLTKGKHLWLRNNGSTLVSQLVDTTLVVVLTTAFTPSQESGEYVTASKMLELVWTGYLIKAAVALLDTPLFYLAIHLIKKWLK